MKRFLILFTALLVLGVGQANPVEVAECLFPIESNTQYVITQDLFCENGFGDLSLGPINSSIDIGGHTIDLKTPSSDVIDNPFIDDWGPYYEIEIYNGTVINCGTVSGGACISWGGSGSGIIYMHHMNITTNSANGGPGNFMTTSVNELAGRQRLENVNLFQEDGAIITGWFLDLDIINLTATIIGPGTNTAVFHADAGNYFFDTFRHTNYMVGNSFFSSGGAFGTIVTLLDTDINPETECTPGGCNNVTWIILERPKPIPVNVTNTGDITIQFRTENNDSIECDNCNGTSGNIVIRVNTNRVHPTGCDFINDFLSSFGSLPNTFRMVQIDKDICADQGTLSAMPILNTLELKNPNSKKYFLFK